MMQKQSISTIGVALAGIVIAFSNSTVEAATLSQQAEDLLKADTGASNYAVKYSDAENAFNNQAMSHSLSFEDWFAINAFINNESAAYGSDGAQLKDLVELDSSLLTWQVGAEDVEVFFVNEGAGYHNKFGYSTAAPTTQGNDSLVSFWDTQVDVIWADVASANSIMPDNGPLALGEGYTVGDVAAGDTVNFYLRNPKNYVFDSENADTTLNGDNLQHVTTYQYEDYLVLAYEDIYEGGDEDYNDVVIAVRGIIDAGDVQAEEVPEPASVLGLLGLGTIGMVIKRRRQA